MERWKEDGDYTSFLKMVKLRILCDVYGVYKRVMTHIQTRGLFLSSLS